MDVRPNSNAKVPGIAPGTFARGWVFAVSVVASLVFLVVSAIFFFSIVVKSTPQLSSIFTKGALPMIVGTFQTSLIALVLAVIVGMGTSISIVFLLPEKLKLIATTLVELLAAVPSIVYGVWGLLVLAPWMLKTVDPLLGKLPFGTSIFGSNGQEFGPSIFLAAIVLTIMILPTFVSISRSVIAAFPRDLIEAGLAVGMTRWEVIVKVVLPSLRSGLFGAGFLALARATGETVAVALCIGGTNVVQSHLLYPGTTIASDIALQFGEANSVQIQQLLALGALLLVINFAFALLSRYLFTREQKLLVR